MSNSTPCGVAALILAAGASRRLGQPKQLVRLGDETLLERTVRVACEAGCAPVLVVLGASFHEVLACSTLGDAVPVINDRWQEGMSASIVQGLRTLDIIAARTPGVLLIACDQPAVTSEHLRALTASGDAAASAYAGRRGVPAYFPVSSFAALTQLAGDSGARELLRAARAVPLPLGELDIDTPEALAEARKLFA